MFKRDFQAFCLGLEALDFPDEEERAQPDRDTVIAARDLLADAMAHDAFLIGMIASEVERLKAGRNGAGLTPFVQLPRTGARFALGYWGPTATPGPHEHTAWTLTAICRNELDVVSFDREASLAQGRLAPKARFKTHRGDVGFLAQPSIHAPKNASDDWTLTMHISSPHDGAPVAGETRTITGLPKSDAILKPAMDPVLACVSRARQRVQQSRFLSRFLLEMNATSAVPILDSCLALVDSDTEAWLRGCMGGAAKSPSRVPRLCRPHEELCLFVEEVADGVALWSRTPSTERIELVFGPGSATAAAFIADEREFDASEIPGGLTGEERRLIVATLERRGLFERTFA